MGQTRPEIIEEVERGLERRMSSVMSQSFENAGGVGAVAEMLNVSDRATERTLLENLSQDVECSSTTGLRTELIKIASIDRTAENVKKIRCGVIDSHTR